jgi:surface antigen
MSGMRRAWPALIVAATVVFAVDFAGAGAARAQIINPFGVNNNNTLSNEDFTLGRAAVTKLLSETPAVGRYETWSNAKTGNHGKLTITSIFTRNSMPCRKLNSLIVFAKKGSAPDTLVFDVCKTSDGWKIAS